MKILRLPHPPTTNTLYANRNGGRFKTARYQTWIRAAIGRAIEQQKWHVGGTIVLDITVERRDNRRADISNKIKAIEDFLVAHGFIDDDRHVAEVRCRWAAKGAVDGCEVRVWAV